MDDAKGMLAMIYKNIACILAFTCLSAGCGGSDSPNSSTASSAGTPEGLWIGKSSDGRSATLIVLSDGTFWDFYSAMGNSAVIAGAQEGNFTFGNGMLSSSNGIDANLESFVVTDFTASGKYVAKSTLTVTGTGTGTVSGGVTVTFNGIYDTDYDLPPSLAAVAGTYSGTTVTLGGYDYGVVTISSTGSFIGTSAAGCSFTGTVSPRTDGNVYDVSATFEGGNCSNGTNIVTGIAYFDASTNKVLAAGLNSDRTNGILAELTKE